MQDLKIALIQSELVWENPKANRQQFAEKIEQLPKDVDLIILPEMFTTGFPVDPQKFAENQKGFTENYLRHYANEKKAVITASLLTKENEKFYNTLIWAEPSGETRRYHKRHVFHLGEESEIISPGMQRIICDLKGWKVNPMICYDLRFPVWTKNTYKDDKFAYDLLIFVANWPEIRNYPWKQLLIARAIENQSYVIGLNRVGKDNKGLNYSGDSMIVGPDGKILAACQPNQEDILISEISYQNLKSFRMGFNVGPDWDEFTIRF